MKILAFTDLHLNMTAFEALKKKAEESKPDYLVCGGDVSIFEENLDWMLAKIASLKIPVLMIHGNHESEGVMRRAIEKYDKFIWIHKKAIDVDGVLFIGFGGGGFSQIEPVFEEWSSGLGRKMEMARKVVLLTHAPPYKTKLDEIFPGEHVGVKSFRTWISQNHRKVCLALSGHIHEAAGRMDQIGDCKLINPSGKGKIIVINNG